MTDHKFCYKAFFEVIKELKLKPRVHRKIMMMPFDHFLNFLDKLVVNNLLLDNTCGCWLREDIFIFGPPPGKEDRVIIEEIGWILCIPYRGRPMDLKNDDYKTKFYNTHLRKYVMNSLSFLES